MGLLDSMNFDDPKTQGLLAAAMQMLQQSGPSLRPNSLGQIIGGGGNAFLGTMQQAKQQQAQQAEQQQMQQMRGLQMQGLQGEFTRHQKAQEQQDAILAAARGAVSTPGQEAASLPGGPTPENAARIPNMSGGFDQEAFLSKVMQFDPLKAMELRKQMAKAGTEFDTKPQVGVGPDGKPFTYILGKDGTQKRLDGTLPRDEMKLANLGGKDVAYNPYALQDGQSFLRTQSPDSVAGNAVAMRGQNMTDSRAREANALARDNKPLTESQGKASLFASRMDKADKLMGALSGAGINNTSAIKSALESVPLVGGVLGAAGNFAASSEQQQLEQAQRDFVNAVLRQESGASISPTEFESAQKQYFPQRGDGDAVKAQKARNRRTAIDGMALQSGAGAGKLGVGAAPGVGGWSITKVE